NSELVQSLAEVHLSRGADAVSALAEKDLIHVQGEDFLLGEFSFHEQRNIDLAHFSLHIAPRRQEHVARYLHGDRARPLANSAGAQIGHGRSQNPLPINAMVTKEAIVLGSQKLLKELWRQLVVANRDAPLLADRLDQLAVARIDAQRH